MKVGEIISKFERKGFQIIGLKLFRPPKELVEVSIFIVVLLRVIVWD